MDHCFSAEPEWISFEKEHPRSDSCWALSAGPDGRVYAAACAERIPGDRALVLRYGHGERGTFILDVSEEAGDPVDSGRATQCKVHYSFASVPNSPRLYMATHLSGAPIDLPAYSPWRFHHDSTRAFRGSALLTYDTETGRTAFVDTLLPREGCRCLAIDDQETMLYALSYPRDHLVAYDIIRRKRLDIGRIGSVNAQVVLSDRRGRVWTGSDDGRLVRYDPKVARLEWSPFRLPHDEAVQNGWHSVLYDAARDPRSGLVYAVTWIASPRLFRLDLEHDPWPIVEDLGPVTQPHDATVAIDTFRDHAGGLAFGPDGMLYYTRSRWTIPDDSPLSWSDTSAEGELCRFNPETGIQEVVARLQRPGAGSQYISRAAFSGDGDLWLGHVGPAPVGVFRVPASLLGTDRGSAAPYRSWG